MGNINTLVYGLRATVTAFWSQTYGPDYKDLEGYQADISALKELRKEIKALREENFRLRSVLDKSQEILELEVEAAKQSEQAKGITCRQVIDPTGYYPALKSKLPEWAVERAEKEGTND